MAHGILTRRGFLAASAAALCSAAKPAAQPGSLGTLNLRLCWVNNSEFAGEFLADHRGYYRAEGFSGANLISGGPTATPTEVELVQDRCLLGLSAVDTTSAAIGEGAPVKIIGSQYTKSAFCLTSLASRPILEPAAMIGRRIGVQSGNQLIFSSFLALNKIDPDKIHVVPVQFDPTPLISGDVDGWVGYITNEPNILKAKGVATTSFLFADHHYPMVMQAYVTKQASIETERDRLKAALRAEIRGWKDNLRDPAEGARLSVEIYGRNLGLDPVVQLLQSKSENALIIGPDTARTGMFRIAEGIIEQNIKVLRAAGMDVTTGDVFDMSLLDEIYKEDPAMLALPG